MEYCTLLAETTALEQTTVQIALLGAYFLGSGLSLALIGLLAWAYKREQGHYPDDFAQNALIYFILSWFGVVFFFVSGIQFFFMHLSERRNRRRQGTPNEEADLHEQDSSGS